MSRPGNKSTVSEGVRSSGCRVYVGVQTHPQKLRRLSGTQHDLGRFVSELHLYVLTITDVCQACNFVTGIDHSAQSFIPFATRYSHSMTLSRSLCTIQYVLYCIDHHVHTTWSVRRYPEGSATYEACMLPYFTLPYSTVRAGPSDVVCTR